MFPIPFPYPISKSPTRNQPSQSPKPKRQYPSITAEPGNPAWGETRVKPNTTPNVTADRTPQTEATARLLCLLIMASQATGGWFFALQSPQSKFPTLREVESVTVPRQWCWGKRGGSPTLRDTILFKVCDVGLASLMCDGVDIAPPRGDEPEVPAAIFPLDKGAHGVSEEAVAGRR